jgi:nicotinamidase/pyrazinamidase
MNFEKNCSLIIIDLQNDFCPGGSLAVNAGNEIIKKINSLQTMFSSIILTQDWHPLDHLSFASNQDNKAPFETLEMSYGTQVLWPNHCVQGTFGAKFHKDLDTSKANIIIRKGYRKQIDSYSAFYENDKNTMTGLDGFLKQNHIKKVYLCGLALDFCVYYSAIDAKNLGYETNVILNATKAIDLDESKNKSLKDMESKNISLINL